MGVIQETLVLETAAPHFLNLTPKLGKSNYNSTNAKFDYPFNKFVRKFDGPSVGVMSY